jgi:LuxR family maltose regulon positive regulatory protein
VRSTGDFARINDWVARLEAAAVPITARVRLWSIWSQCMQGRLAEARRMLADIETTAELGAFDRAFAERLWLDIAARSGTSEDVCGKAEAWLQRWSESSPLHVAGVALALALALFERGEEGAAGRRLAMAREAGFRVNGTYTRAWVLGVEAYVDLLAGHAHGAVALIGEALGVAREDSGTATPLFGALSQLAAAIYYEQGNLAAAQEYLGLGRRVHDAHVIDTRLLGQWAAAGLSNLEAGPDEALIELRRWRQDNPRFARATGLQTVHLLLRAGRWSDARAEFEATGRPGIADGAASTTIRQDCAYAEASVLFAEGDLPGAQTLTQAIVAHSEAHGRGQRLVAALLLRSAIEFARRDTPASDRTLARALNLAAAGGLVQTVLSLDWAVAERLGQVGLQGRLDPHVRTFVQALRSRLGLPPLREPGSGQRQSLEPLTAREREILAMLESDGSAQDLAASMSIGLATAKWHIRNVYTKLGVRSRAGALALARDVGLI